MDRFGINKYYSKKKFLKLLGGEIRIFNEDQTQLLFFVKQKALKLKEDITIFADESQQDALLNIKARSAIDFSAAYDITDAKTGQKIGAAKRQGLKSSFVMDQWDIMDASDNVVGTIIEDSWIKALVRRYILNLLPQTYHMIMGMSKESGKEVGILKQTFNPFIAQFNVDFSMDTGNQLDRKLGIALVILIQIIEGRQSGG